MKRALIILVAISATIAGVWIYSNATESSVKSVKILPPPLPSHYVETEEDRIHRIGVTNLVNAIKRGAGEAAPPPIPAGDIKPYDGPWPSPTQIKRKELQERMDRRARGEVDEPKPVQKQTIFPSTIPDTVKRHHPENVEQRKTECLDRSEDEVKFAYFEGVLTKLRDIVPPGECPITGCSPDSIRELALHLRLKNEKEQVVYAGGTQLTVEQFLPLLKRGEQYGACAVYRKLLNNYIYAIPSREDLILIGHDASSLQEECSALSEAQDRDYRILKGEYKFQKTHMPPSHTHTKNYIIEGTFTDENRTATVMFSLPISTAIVEKESDTLKEGEYYGLCVLKSQKDQSYWSGNYKTITKLE